MKHFYENDTLTVTFPDVVNSSNAPELMEEFLAIIGENSVNRCRFDCSELRYIASSGLRIIMKSAKEIKATELTEVSDDVYEILEITGFTEIVKVYRRLKNLDVSGCALIGRGRNAAVYRYNNDTIVKVYLRDNVSFEDVQREHLLARRAFIMGVPTAISLHIVNVDGHLGAMYEMIDAKSFLKLIKEQPEKISENMKKYSDVVKHINSIEVTDTDELVDKKAEYAGWIRFLKDYLTDEEYRRTEALLSLIPDERKLVHGDCQPGNVMLQGDEIVIIDMDTLGYGSSLIELSNIYSTLVAFQVFDREYALSTEECELCWRLFEREYFDGVPAEDKIRQLTLCKALAFGRAYRYGLRHRERVEDTHIEYFKTQLFHYLDVLGI